MNILFSFTHKNKSQQNDCCAIAHLLKTDNGNVILFCGNTSVKNESGFDNFAMYSANQHTHFDCVIAYTKTGLQQITEFATNK